MSEVNPVPRAQSKRGLRVSQAAIKLGVSVPTVWRWASERPDFPKPRKLGPNVTVFDEGELDAFLSGAKAAA
jgi:predicted DNA-binding transcriptional regulator AlpA